MILLDTNVVSEPLRPRPEPAVVAWLDAQNAETLFLSAISIAELGLGVERLPAGRRRQMLATGLGAALTSLFGERILPFDEHAAWEYARLVARAGTSGHSVGIADGQIAAIASVHGFMVASRDQAPFVACGIMVVNPWDGTPTQ
jgi:predicted nucleic acid-binding protein